MKSISYNEVLENLQKAQVKLGPSVRLLQDSRQVSKGDVFVAIKGTTRDGASFIDAAIEAGASAVLLSSNCDVGLSRRLSEVSAFQVSDLESHLAKVCQAFYFSDNTSAMPLVAITGTNGKTSISHLLAQLSEINQKQSMAVIGTMGTGVLKELKPSENTTPGVTEVYQLLHQFEREHQLTGVAMEVSSHALEQGRVKGLEFDVAVYTNLTHDHLDYHGTMEDYFAAKCKLFTENRPKFSVINVDDSYGERLVNLVPGESKVIAYGASETVKSFADYVFIESAHCHAHGLEINFEWQLDGRKESTQLQLPLYGLFNASNIAAVFASAVALGWPVQEISFSQLRPVPGRLELFVKPNLPVAIVDYAHTPDALQQSLSAVRAHLSGRLYVVFGCGGDRDRTKRPLMASIAEQLADYVIVTNDNPRTESPEHIVADIKAGFKHPEAHSTVLSRKEAIRKSLSMADGQDAVLIAGKGHETYQIIGNETIAYDERQFTETLMNELSNQGVRA